MGGVYMKLGFKKEMHWTQRVGILDNEICPLIPKNLDEWLEITVETTEDNQGGFTPVIVEPNTEPRPDPAMMALVLYDETMIEETANNAVLRPNPKVIEIPPNSRRPSCLSRILTSLALVGIVTLIGYGAYIFGRSSATQISPQVQVVTATFPPTSMGSPVPLFTETSIPLPTFTPKATSTPIPTKTPKEYYDEEEAVLLKNGIYMFLNKDFTTSGGPCGKPKIGFGVVIVFEDTISEQFLIRFNSGDFRARDNLGNEYRLSQIGVSGAGFCSDPIGIPLEYTMTYGYWRAYIAMQFEGQVPLEATDIFITADWISGVGPITFKKSIN
jgi:hypothetical protein